MSRRDRLMSGADTQFHPVSHYGSPTDVLTDDALSPAEKRVILSSWASDMYAVDSQPGLREIPGIARPMQLADILAALRRLDEKENGLRGEFEVGMTVRAPEAARTPKPRIVISVKSRWSSEANVRRYRRLLATQLTENERRYIERRLAEEIAQLRSQGNVTEKLDSQ